MDQIELLTHPNIPKPVHSVVPRDILGKPWWDKQRQMAYARYRYHCWACGVHKSKAEYYQWLEGHESYEINYEEGIVRLREIVALCHACHNFIHSGRLWIQYQRRKIPHATIEHIYQRGFDLLKSRGLKPFWGTAYQWLILKGYNERDAERIVFEKELIPKITKFAAWTEWRLILEGQEYRFPFKNMHEWEAYYATRNKLE